MEGLIYSRIPKFSEICLLTRVISFKSKRRNMLPPLGEAPTPHSNIGDISGNYKRILTKFSGICLLTMLKYVTPSWGNIFQKMLPKKC